MNAFLLQQVMTALFPGAVYQSDWTMAVDSAGNATIRTWNNALGAQPTTAELTAQLTALLLGQAKLAQAATLQAAFAAAVASPVTYMSASFANDPAHQQLLSRATQAFTLANAVPSGFFVPDVNSVPVTMTLAQLQGLVQAIATQEWAAFTKWITLQKAVATATTVAAVQAVVWS